MPKPQEQTRTGSILTDLVAEGVEMLSVMVSSLKSLESNPNDVEALSGFHRCVRQLQGAAEVTGMNHLWRLSNAVAQFLAVMCTLETTQEEKHLRVLRAYIVEVGRILKSIRDTREEGKPPVDGEAGRLFRFAQSTLQDVVESDESPPVDLDDVVVLDTGADIAMQNETTDELDEVEELDDIECLDEIEILVAVEDDEFADILEGELVDGAAAFVGLGETPLAETSPDESLTLAEMERAEEPAETPVDSGTSSSTAESGDEVVPALDASDDDEVEATCVPAASVLSDEDATEEVDKAAEVLEEVEALEPAEAAEDEPGGQSAGVVEHEENGYAGTRESGTVSLDGEEVTGEVSSVTHKSVTDPAGVALAPAATLNADPFVGDGREAAGMSLSADTVRDEIRSVERIARNRESSAPVETRQDGVTEEADDEASQAQHSLVIRDEITADSFDGMLQDFIEEGNESLDNLETALLTLESEPEDVEALTAVFRILHSLKGLTGMMGLDGLNELAHRGESFFALMRDGRLRATPERISLAMQVGDLIRVCLAELPVQGRAAEEMHGEELVDLVRRLDGLCKAGAPLADGDARSFLADVTQDLVMEGSEHLERMDNLLLRLEKRPTDQDILSGIFRCLHSLKSMANLLGCARLASVAHRGEDLLGMLRDGSIQPDMNLVTLILNVGDAVRLHLECLRTSGVESEEAFSELLASLDKTLGDERNSLPTATPSSLGTITRATQKPEAKRPERAVEAGAAGDGLNAPVRLDVQQLERLMEMVGELVQIRNQLDDAERTGDIQAFRQPLAHLGLAMNNLQKGMLKTRMQPLRTIFSRFPRLVRDLSHKCEKQVRLEISGEETEIDRALLAALKNPMTHMIRNAIDHGLESASERARGGKSEEGRIAIRAWHEGGRVRVDVSDDGRGLGFERIREKGIALGLASPEEVRAMDEERLIDFLFHPGFSTTNAVSDVSGRGVGLDVVKTDIERIGGSLRVLSSSGEGTTFCLSLPLTLSIISSLIVRVGGQPFAIPQINIREVVCLRGQEGRLVRSPDGGTTSMDFRGSAINVVRLREQFRMPARGDTARLAKRGDKRYICIIHTDNGDYGLEVDVVDGAQETVVKPLGRHLQQLRVFNGGCILGSSEIAPVIDVNGLAGACELECSTVEEERLVEARISTEEEEPVVLFKTLGNERMGLPLQYVRRMGMLERESIRYVGDQPIIWHRDNVVPIHVVDGLEQGIQAKAFRPDAEDGDRLQLIVFGRRGREAGLVVRDIIDISHDSSSGRGEPTRSGVAWTSRLLDDDAIEVLDAEIVFGGVLQNVEKLREQSA